MRFFVLGVVFLLGCGEEFTAAEVRAFDPPSSGEGGEPASIGGASSTGGIQAGGMAGSAVASGGSGSMSGSGGNPSGGSENTAGTGGSGGSGSEAGSGGSGGAPWMPSRCVEPPEGVRVEHGLSAFQVDIFGLTRPPSEIEVRWWLSVDGECPEGIHYWFHGSGAWQDTVTFRMEPEEHDTPEGHQTHVIIIGNTRTTSVNETTIHISVGGCVPWSGPEYQNDYSATKPENVGVYVGGELVAGCEP